MASFILTPRAAYPSRIDGATIEKIVQVCEAVNNQVAMDFDETRPTPNFPPSHVFQPACCHSQKLRSLARG